MKQKIIPIVSILFGVIAFALSWNYLQKEKDKIEKEKAAIYAGAAKIRVMVVRGDVPKGTVIRGEDLATHTVFKSHVGGRAVLPEQAEMLLGKKLITSLKRGDPILWSDIEGGADVAMGLAPMIKPGLRAISLSASGASAVSSMIQPNDRVDVLGTFSFPSKKVSGEMETVTLTVLQNVNVLATGQKMANQQYFQGERPNSSGYSTVTLEVTAREAELLVFAQQVKGRLTLSLRNPTDVSFETDLPEINFDHIENKLPELNLYRQKNILHKRNL